MILLDEPSMGLSPLVVEQIFEIILRLNCEQGITILLVEQNVKLALSVSSYAYILRTASWRSKANPPRWLRTRPCRRRI